MDRRFNPRYLLVLQDRLVLHTVILDVISYQQKTSKIDALFRGVKVREVNPAPTHPAKGYFDVDWIIPTPDRSNFTASKESVLFFSEIKKYILRKYSSKE